MAKKKIGGHVRNRELTLDIFVEGAKREDVAVSLTEECEQCEGVGKVVDPYAETFSRCPNVHCRGGQVPTINGFEILKLVEWFGKPKGV